MNNNCLIVFNQGFTDIIICIGLIFYNLKIYKNVYVLVKPSACEFLKFLCKNYNNIDIISLEPKHPFYHSTEQIDTILQNINDCELLPYGEFYTPPLIGNEPIYYSRSPNSDIHYLAGSEYFYSYYTKEKINPDEYYKSFILNRDHILEEKFYSKTIEKLGTEYIVINSDHIDIPLNINNNYPRFNLSYSTNIVFDAIKTIENAKEIHLTSTFWSKIIDILQKKYNLFENIPIYFHSYCRHGYLDFLYQNKNWIYIYCDKNCKHPVHNCSGYVK
jgi:hypothetical protein